MSNATGTLSKGPYSRLLSRSSMWRTFVRRPERLTIWASWSRTSCCSDCSSAAWNSKRSTVTTWTTRLSTRILPWASKIRPLGASEYTTRRMLLAATSWSSSLSRTCRYQSRANRAATRHTATMPIA